MARPVKCRRVEFLPDNTYFIPSGKKKCEIKDIVLKVEELEAMRLKDIEGLTQEECADSMQVSRQTFQNIINSARKKVAEALTQGKAIRISGGNYVSDRCQFKCLNCGEIYRMNFEQDRYLCPSCGAKETVCMKKHRFCHRRQRKLRK